MKLAVFYHHIREAAEQTGKSLSEIAAQVFGFGITTVEVDLADILAAEAEGRSFDKELGAVGLGVSSIYGFYDFGNTLDMARMEQHIRAARKLETKRIMIIPGFYSSTELTEREAERERMLIGMKQVCSLAAKNGIIPTIEDFDDSRSPIATAEQMQWFLTRIPELRVAFDTGNFMYSEQDEVEAYELLKDKIVHVHCKDRALEYRPNCEEKKTISGRAMYPAVVGSGQIAMEQLVRALEKRGYDGIYTIEHFGAENQLAFMQHSAEWLWKLGNANGQ